MFFTIELENKLFINAFAIFFGCCGDTASPPLTPPEELLNEVVEYGG